MSKNYNIPVVWQIAALNLNKKTLLYGVLLKGIPYSFNKKVTVFKNLINLIRSYFITAYANKNISIKSNGKTINVITDKNGGFRSVTDSLHEGEIKIYIPGKDEPLRILQSYPITFKNTDSDIDVISDIDDTIIVSYTANFFKRVGTLVFKEPKKRKVIGYTQKMFVAFIDQNSRMIYVSKSEGNLFKSVTDFIEHNDLPKGMLFLTPYLNFHQLFGPKKGDFKIDNIRFLIENTGTKNYVLFGDDSQLDMNIYSKIAKDYPKRILKIYIRQTKPIILPNQKQMMENLKSVGVPVKYFKSDDDLEVSDELIQLKL